MSRPFPLHTGMATVVAIHDVTPAMRCFTLAADAFRCPGVEQPGEILTLGWCDEGEELALPLPGWRFPPGRAEQHWRNLTVRRIDPLAGTLDVEFYLHGDAGRAASWALRARVGDQVGFAGPRTHFEPLPDAAWTLLVADETGLPALLAILDTLDPAHEVIALAEVADPADRRDVPEVGWLPRGVMAAAVERLVLPDGPGQVWGGGEAMVMRDVRRHLAAARPDLRGRMRILGYWKRDDAVPWEEVEEETG